VDSRAGLDDLEKGIFLTLPGLELQPVTSRYTDYATSVPGGPYVYFFIFLVLCKYFLRNPSLLFVEHDISTVIWILKFYYLN
jgi:hypothetical protein